MTSAKSPVLIFLTLLLVTLLGCQGTPARTTVPPVAVSPTATIKPTATISLFQELEEREKIIDSHALAFAEKYKATTGWQNDLLYTYQAQKRLTMGQPKLLRGNVDDIFIRDGATFVRFSNRRILGRLSFFDYSAPHFVFELKCREAIVDDILMRVSDDSFYPKRDEYAIVATIDDVSKSIVSIRSFPIGPESAEIDIEAPSLVIVRGTCIDITLLPSRLQDMEKDQ